MRRPRHILYRVMQMKRNFWTGAVTLTVFGLAVAYSSAVRQAVLAAGERCLTVLIPSLYV